MFLEPSHFDALCQMLGYTFKNPELLAQAITRKSAYLEGIQTLSIGHNETLATLGDGILRTAIDDILIETNQDYAKGQLSPERDKFVSNAALAKLAQQLDLGRFIIMGKGEVKNYQTGGHVKILSGCFEAIMGALFIDSQRDYKVIKGFVIRHWDFTHLYEKKLIDAVLKESLADVKTLLDLRLSPNTLGSTTIFMHHIALKNSGACKKGQFTLFYGGYGKASLLELAMVSKRVVPEHVLKGVKPKNITQGTVCRIDAGKGVILGDNYIQMVDEDLSRLSHDASLPELLALMSTINLEGHGVKTLSICRNLDLPERHPGIGKLLTLFSSTVSNNCLKIIELLLAKGANPNLKPLRHEWYPLHSAAELGNADVIQLFLKYGADIYLRDAEGKVPADVSEIETIRQMLLPKAEGHKNMTFFKQQPVLTQELTISVAKGHSMGHKL
jgi:dsRNA-specific ribonuclease